jgi:hypothetical protein
MVKFILVNFIEFLLALTLITQVLIPIFFPKLRFFWLFRSSESKANISSLNELNIKASKNRSERDEILGEMSTAEEVLKEIKSKSK